MTDVRELERLEPQFFRAPSAHNTQPWLLEYARERVALRFDPERALPVGDPTRRDLLLSLGALVESALISASAAGIALQFEPQSDAERCYVGAFIPADVPYETPFTPGDLDRRQTSRLAYEPGRLATDDLEAARSRVGGDAVLHEVDTRDLVDLAVAADRHLFDSPKVVEELRSWLRLSPRHPRYERDGLSYDCLGLGRLTGAAFALALRPRVYRTVHALRLHRAFASTTKFLLDRDGSALVLCGVADTPEQVLTHGRTLLSVWLALGQRGLYTHPLSQILDCPATERELAARVGGTPISVFRAGRSAQPARSHRLR